MWLIPADSRPNQGHQLSPPDQWLVKHGDLLFRMAFRYVSDQTAAEDIVQETLLAALLGRAQFSGAAAEQTWLVGILKNKAMDHFRSASRQVELQRPGDSAAEPSGDFINEGPDQGMWAPERRPAPWKVDDSDPVEREEFWLHLNKCLDSLEPRQAKAYRLRELQEIESQDVCNVMALSPTNLRVILHRVRLQLRRCLEHNWIESDSRNG